MEDSTAAIRVISQASVTKTNYTNSQRSDLIKQSRQTPRISEERLQASLDDKPLNIQSFMQNNVLTQGSSKETFLYLGYGSNLSAETFRGRRNIKPLSQINVVVPEITLSFNLPGIPYAEPCFANSRYRTPSTPTSTTSEKQPDYHKDHWTKGLVGVVYEVTSSDYAHIIATEGGGSGYQDVLVSCYTLPSSPREKVPDSPTGTHFKAHTLFAPSNIHSGARPDPSYAQPSARYLKLITNGAAEHGLPYEYQAYLHQIRPYHITKIAQRLGQFVFVMLWAPLFLFFFGGGAAVFLRKDGTYPDWYKRFARSVFEACWASYDGLFRGTFGDGERTIGDGGGDGDGGEDKTGGALSEKAPLIREAVERYGVGGRLDMV